MTENGNIWEYYLAIDLIKRIKTEETNKMYVDRHKAFALAISALEEVQKYREIGTVEECREAMKKQRPERVAEDDYCPVCGTCGVDDDGIISKYCMECGQKLDWSKKLQAAGLIRGGTEE